MSELWLPAGVAVAAIALTYLFCIRPMRRGHCGMMPSSGENELDKELSEARTTLSRMLADGHRGHELIETPRSAEAPRSTAPTWK